MGITPDEDPFGGGRIAVECSTDAVQKARAIAGGAIRLAQHGRHVRKFAEFLGEQAEALARDLESKG